MKRNIHLEELRKRITWITKLKVNLRILYIDIKHLIYKI